MHHITRCPKHTFTAALQPTAPRPMISGVVACQGASWAGCSTPSPCPAPPCCMPRNAAPRRAAPRRVAPHRTASRSIATHQSRTKGTAVVVVMCVPYVEEGPGPSHQLSRALTSARVCRILVVKAWAIFEMVIYRKLQAHQIEDRRSRARKLLLLLHGRYPVAGRGRAKARAPRITRMAFSLAP